MNIFVNVPFSPPLSSFLENSLLSGTVCQISRMYSFVIFPHHSLERLRKLQGHYKVLSAWVSLAPLGFPCIVVGYHLIVPNSFNL